MTPESLVELKAALTLVMSEEVNADSSAMDEEVMFLHSIFLQRPSEDGSYGDNSLDVMPIYWCWV